MISSLEKFDTTYSLRSLILDDLILRSSHAETSDLCAASDRFFLAVLVD